MSVKPSFLVTGVKGCYALEIALRVRGKAKYPKAAQVICHVKKLAIILKHNNTFNC